MYPACADPDLGTKPITESICESRARVDISARGIHGAAESRRSLVVFCHDAVGVVRRVRVDEFDSGLQRWNGNDGEDKGEVLC